MSAELPITIVPVMTTAQRREFVDLLYRLNRGDPNWVPPLRDDAAALINPKKNPWFGHGRAQLFLARRGERNVGRISAHIDDLALDQPPEQGFGPGTGFWGLFEAEDSDVTGALLAAAEDWLRDQGMTRMLGPVSLAMWDEPGLLIAGHDHPPSVMMGHNVAAYQGWIETLGHTTAQDLVNYRVPITDGFPELANRIVALGEKSGRIRIRKVDKSRFAEEAALIIGILNDAWSGNWGFTPWTAAEIAYGGEKLKPIVFEDLIRIAEVDGEPVAFMMTVPDLNEQLVNYDGTLWPLNWARLLWWLRRPRVRLMRVPLMGVAQKLQGTRMASQIALMLIEYIRRDAVANYGATHGDFGWVLDSNGPMKSVGEAVGGVINKTYRIYVKSLAAP
jgi:GNAT superfamily N-acetyltransferase